MKDKKIRLEDLERKVPFEVPDGYFDKLPSIVMSRLPATPEPQPLISWSWQRSLGLAAALSLIVALVWFSYPQQQGSLGSERLSQVSDDAILEYLTEENISYYDLSENNAVQAAFQTDSTVLYYLDGLDADFLRSQAEDGIFTDETI
ncbi:hypothetical protein [Persicitalea jodogahamensis]|uniref:Uncharacterized protein n=1 Tax=Persicitalea jodogahamensis TaxID=402147 RepID=A0A8J3D235_9BACT|nr:hypothetical protein [Persicitalea jodogahamensis]GHB59533.1 hypothetical protein GCM10007390_11500 [Persicitalea jodogahamensis]